MTVLNVILVLFCISTIALTVALIAQERAIRRVVPWAARFFETRDEGTGLEVTDWISAHIHPVHHLVVSSALRRLEWRGELASRPEQGAPERQGRPEFVYWRRGLMGRHIDDLTSKIIQAQTDEP